MKYKYVGRGEFLHGIPARDLSEADWQQLSETQQAAVRNAPQLYQAKSKKAAGKKDGE